MHSFLIGLLTYLLFISVTHAAEISLSLQDAFKLASQNDPSLSMAKLDIETGDAQVREAYSAAMPVIAASGSMTHYMVAPSTYVPALEGNVRFVPLFSYSAGLNLTQPIWLAGKVGLGLRAAQTYRQIARSAINVNQATLKSEVVKDYFGLVLARELVNVTQESLDQAQRHADVVKRMYDVGMASEFDLLRATVAVRNVEPELANSRKMAELAQVKLTDRLGLEHGSTIKLTESLNRINPLGESISTANAYDNALSNRAEFQVFDLQNDLRSIALTAEQRNLYWPNFMFMMGYNSQASQDVFELGESEWLESFDWTINVSIPLFDGFATQSKVQKAKIELRRVALQRLQVTQGVRLEVTNAIAELNRSKELVASRQATVEMAEKALSIAHTRYEQGVGTELDVLDAQLQVKNAKLGYLQGLYDQRVADAEYQRVVNGDATFGN